MPVNYGTPVSNFHNEAVASAGPRARRTANSIAGARTAGRSSGVVQSRSTALVPRGGGPGTSLARRGPQTSTDLVKWRPRGRDMGMGQFGPTSRPRAGMGKFGRRAGLVGLGLAAGALIGGRSGPGSSGRSSLYGRQ